MADARRFHSLDALRGLAALAVVAYHVGQASHGGSFIAASGYLAVDFFFLLSGFVIARAYETRLRNGLGFWRFTRLRLVRLYPLFLFGIVIALGKPVLQIVTGDDMAPEPAEVAGWFAANVAMLPAPGADSLFPLNPPAWSLFLEILVNLAYAGLLLVLSTRVLWVIALVCGAVLAWGAIGAGTADLGWGWQTLHFGFARVGWSFTIGVLLARTPLGESRRETWFALAPMAALAAVLMLPLGDSLRGPANAAVILLVFPALMIWAANTEAPKALRGLCSAAGDVSYPLYAIHYPLMLLYLAGVQRVAGFGWEAAIWFVPVSLVLSWIVLKVFDEPVRSRLTAAMRSGPLPATVPPVSR
jgi:peptidoglycan/LPS O-acetylase OafA/YrhL